MSEPENFLSRWSRRKLEAEPEANPSAPRESGDPAPQGKTESDQQTTESAAPDSRLRGNERDAEGNSDQGASTNKKPAFDLSTLPSIESITAETDIRVFLQKGVPAELGRAALRRAWIADPNIRDFKEMAENQWDFATGSDLPGFGPLDATADDIRKMVADVFGGGPKLTADVEAKSVPGKAETRTDAGQSESAESIEGQPRRQEIAAAREDQTLPEGAPSEPAKDVVQRNQVNVALQQNNQEHEYKPLPTRRAHGRALPE